MNRIKPLGRVLRMAAGTLLCAAMAAGAATVTGTVRTGGQGGQGGGGTPVEGAKVVLIGLGGQGGGGLQTRLDSTTTDAQGKYTFANATTGFRQLQASKTGLSNGNGATNVATDTGTYTVNINMLAAPRTGPGKVMGTVRRGSATGAPIAGATVVLTRGFGGTGGAQPDTLKTDAQGKYSFDSVAAATYTVRVTMTGYQPGNDNVSVPAGDTAISDFELMPLNAVGSVGGKVTKASDGSAVANAQVILSRGGGGQGGGMRPDTVQSDAQGVYSFDSVGVQTNYVVTVKATGFQTAINQNVDVGLDIKTAADFALVAAGADTTHGSISGTVTDAAHKALANARVILARTGGAGGGQQATPVDTVQTDAQGKFTFPSVTEGNNYRLTVSLTGYQTATDANVDVVAGQSAVANFALASSSGIGMLAGSQPGMRLRALGAGRILLELPASSASGRVILYDAAGQRAFEGLLPAGATSMEIPSRGGMGYVVVERDGRMDRRALNP